MMKPSDIFLLSAQMLEELPAEKYYGMCNTIAMAVLNYGDINIKLLNQCKSFLHELFEPEDNTHFWFSLSEKVSKYHVSDWDEAKKLRVNILIWCHIIALSEGL